MPREDAGQGFQKIHEGKGVFLNGKPFSAGHQVNNTHKSVISLCTSNKQAEFENQINPHSSKHLSK